MNTEGFITGLGQLYNITWVTIGRSPRFWIMNSNYCVFAFDSLSFVEMPSTECNSDAIKLYEFDKVFNPRLFVVWPELRKGISEVPQRKVAVI